MARKPSKAKTEQVQPEEPSREAPGSTREKNGVTKASAARAALSEGLEMPEEAVDFIKRTYGIELSRQHFSAIKSQLRKKEREDAEMNGPRPGRGRPKGSTKKAIEGYLAPPPKRALEGSGELLAALETIKPLIAHYGADQVKRIVDLLG